MVEEFNLNTLAKFATHYLEGARKNRDAAPEFNEKEKMSLIHLNNAGAPCPTLPDNSVVKPLASNIVLGKDEHTQHPLMPSWASNLGACGGRQMPSVLYTLLGGPRTSPNIPASPTTKSAIDLPPHAQNTGMFPSPSNGKPNAVSHHQENHSLYQTCVSVWNEIETLASSQPPGEQQQLHELMNKVSTAILTGHAQMPRNMLDDVINVLRDNRPDSGKIGAIQLLLKAVLI
jgi:hypothetical protein